MCIHTNAVRAILARWCLIYAHFAAPRFTEKTTIHLCPTYFRGSQWKSVSNRGQISRVLSSTGLQMCPVMSIIFNTFSGNNHLVLQVISTDRDFRRYSCYNDRTRGPHANTTDMAQLLSTSRYLQLVHAPL